MKHGIYYAYWEKEWEADYVKYVKKVADLGFDILEIGAKPLPEYSKDDIERLKAATQQYSIQLTCGYGPAKEQNIADLKTVKEAFLWYKKLFKTMKALDSHYLGGAIYFYWPVSYAEPINKERDWELSVQGMKKLAAMAQRYDIIIGVEVLNRFEGYLLNTAAEGVQYVKDVGMDNVRVHLDTFHMSIEETNICQAIRETGKYLGHLHTGERNRMVPGMGSIPWREIGAALHEIGYDKAVVMEPFVQRGGTVGSDIKIWHDLIDDLTEDKLDSDAKRALEFQKYMLDRD